MGGEEREAEGIGRAPTLRLYGAPEWLIRPCVEQQGDQSKVKKVNLYSAL